MDRIVHRRRAVTLLLVGVIITALSFGLGHRGVHAVRSLLVPGAGLYDHRHLVLGITLTVLAVAATYAWLRWGTDWLVLAVVIGSMVLSAVLAYDDHAVHRLEVSSAAHEFPLVVLVMAAISWLRMAWRRSPLARIRTGRPAPRVPLVDQCRAAALTSIAVGSTPATGTAHPTSLTDTGALDRRCRRIGIVARARFTGEPMRTDHAHVRAALALAGRLDQQALDLFRTDATRSFAGVPASEPGWVRLLDGTLAGVALERLGDRRGGVRWAQVLDGPFGLRHGHRPSAVWTPLALRGPRGATWEHAAATGLARAAGWIATDDDWEALRTRTLAAAARGNTAPDDERLVAAGRIWLRFVDDDQAARILRRVTIHLDPIAVALDAVASALAADPLLLTTLPTPDAPDEPALQSTRRTR